MCVPILVTGLHRLVLRVHQFGAGLGPWYKGVCLKASMQELAYIL